MGGDVMKWVDPGGSNLGFYGDGGKSSPAAATTPATTPASPSTDEDAKTRDGEDAGRRRRGRAASMATGRRGSGVPSTAAKALTGE